MWKQCAVVLLSIVPALALPITTHAVLEPSVHDQLLELEKEAGSVERAVAGRAERSLERKTASGPAGAIAKLSVPDSAFGTAENPRVPEMFVRTQHAHCPDAQCPKAKMENIGLAAKGYNLLFGNPFSTTPGIDPGFTARGGSAIWEFEYTKNLETADGRFERPDSTQVEHNVGCSLTMSNAVTHSASEETEESSRKVRVSAEGTNLVVSGSFSADTRWAPPS